MSDLLSGLESMGLGGLEGMNLFDEPKEEESNENENMEPEVVETDFLIEKTFTCPVCSHKFKSVMPKTGKSRVIDSDIDGRPIYEFVDLSKYDVIACPKCGYAVTSRYHVGLTDKQRSWIVDKISRNFKGAPEDKKTYTYEEALERYKLALVNAIVRQAKASEKAYICMKAGWLMRGYANWLDTPEGRKQEDADMAKQQALKLEEEYMKNAYEGFTSAVSNEMPPIAGMDESTLNYMLATLAYRFGQLGVASKLIGMILTSPAAPSRLKDKTRDLKEMIIAKLKENRK